MKRTVKVKDVVEMTSLSESTIRRMCRDGTFRYKQRKANSPILIFLDSVESWLNESEKPKISVNVKYGRRVG